MAVTHNPAGFTGTVDQLDEARRFALGGGGRFRVGTSTDWQPTANAGVNRTVNIAPGAGAACGVYDSTTATDSVAFAANTGGADRFDAVVARFDWSTMAVSFQVIQGTTSLPAVVKTGTVVDNTKINWLPGLRYDAVLAVVRARPGVAILAPADLYDVRLWGAWNMLRANTVAYPLFDLDTGMFLRDATTGIRYEYNGTALTEGASLTMIRLTGTGDASPTSTIHPFQIGDSSGFNLIIDNNEIMGRNNGVLTSWGAGGSRINNVGTPTYTTDAATKGYVDGLMQRGTVAFNLNGTTQDTGLVTFSTAFPSAPSVAMSIYSSTSTDFIATLITTPSTNGFSWRVRERGGAAVSAGGVLHWIASVG